METTPPENNGASNEASTEDNSDMNIKAKKKCSTPPTSASPVPTVDENEASTMTRPTFLQQTTCLIDE